MILLITTSWSGFVWVVLMSNLFVRDSAIRYEGGNSSFFYFEDKGVLFKGKGCRAFIKGFGNLKVRGVELKTIEQVKFGRVSQNTAIQKLILSYGLPILSESKEARRERYFKYEKGKKRVRS